MVEPVVRQPLRGQLAIIGVFALGAVFGLAVSFVWRHHVMRPDHSGPQHGGPVSIERMSRDLDLDPAQQGKIRDILERGHAHVRGLLDDTSRDVRAVLRPDQQAKFDRMRPRSPFPPGPAH